MKKRNYWKLYQIALILLILSFTSCSTTEMIDELEDPATQFEEVNIKSAGRFLCEEVPVSLGVAGNWDATSITMNQYDKFVFYTTPVCNATEYTWIVDGQASMTTTSFSIELEGLYFLWLPPDGCGGFNGKWEAYNPLFNASNPCWEGIPLGRYTSSLEVIANTSPVSHIIPVIVENVEYCREGSFDCSTEEEDEEEEEEPMIPLDSLLIGG